MGGEKKKKKYNGLIFRVFRFVARIYSFIGIDKSILTQDGDGVNRIRKLGDQSKLSLHLFLNLNEKKNFRRALSHEEYFYERLESKFKRFKHLLPPFLLFAKFWESRKKKEKKKDNRFKWTNFRKEVC